MKKVYGKGLTLALFLLRDHIVFEVNERIKLACLELCKF